MSGFSELRLLLGSRFSCLAVKFFDFAGVELISTSNPTKPYAIFAPKTPNTAGAGLLQSTGLKIFKKGSALIPEPDPDLEAQPDSNNLNIPVPQKPYSPKALNPST